LLDHEPGPIEAEDRNACERDLDAILDDRRPPLDRGTIAGHDRLADPDPRVAFLRERLLDVLPDPLLPVMGLAEGLRGKPCSWM
jgi:hypothetical protein